MDEENENGPRKRDRPYTYMLLHPTLPPLALFLFGLPWVDNIKRALTLLEKKWPLMKWQNTPCKFGRRLWSPIKDPLIR